MPLVNSDDDRRRYNEFVRNSPYGRCTQDLNWGHVKNNWATDGVYLEEDGEIIAALTILSVDGALGKRLLYANRGPVCDFYDVDLVVRLLKEAEAVINKYDSFLLRLDPEVPYDQELIEKYRSLGYTFRGRETNIHSFVQPRYNMVLYLNGLDEEEVFNSFHSKTRYNIRLSGRKGITTDYISLEKDGEDELNCAIDRFYDLTEIMATRQGITHRPKSYFNRLFEAFPDSRVYESSYNGEVLSSALAIPYGKKLFYMYGASSNNERNRMPNFSMQWEMIKWAIEMKMDMYDFGGVFSLDDSDGLYKFKRGFCNKDGHSEWIGELDLVLDSEAYSEYNK